MSIFRTLESEHDQVRSLLNESLKEEGKSEVFQNLGHLLDIHMQGEEKYLYPKSKSLGFTEDALESIEEHHVSKIILKELREMSGKEENWIPKLQVLKETIEHHLEEEEERLFPETEKKISDDDQDEIENEYSELKERMKESER